MAAQAPLALLFDVFGTVVDWRTSVAGELTSVLGDCGEPGAEALADAWRARYQPAMEAVRSGARPWTILDVLHQENLLEALAQFGLDSPDESTLDHLNRAWHRLRPWPDAVAGLARLKRRFIIAPHSNGNISLLTNLGKSAGLGWDVILGAEVVRAYKPLPESYRRAAAALGLDAAQCMMVAAHNGDLRAAAAQGLQTAFVARPLEHGPMQTTDLAADADWSLVAHDFGDLADQLDC